jgi:VanZ family protein
MHLNKRGRTVAWGLLALAVPVNIAGYAFNLYNRILWFDNAMHFYTPLILTLALALYLYDTELGNIREHRFLLTLATTTGVIALGSLWEIAEWVYDLFIPGDAIRGINDTMLDLLLNVLGAALAGIIIVRMYRGLVRG